MTTLDESLYSRQLYVLGKDAMEAVTNTNVLIYGMSGANLEVAKCVALAGVKSITLFDNKKIKYIDLASNYYAQPNDVGKNRVDIVISKLQELNPYVTITKSTEEKITENFLKSFNVAVFSDINHTSAIYYNSLARKHSVKFILVNTFGLYGYVFCDFGHNFIIKDTDGENPISRFLVEIKDGCYVCDEPHYLSVGDKIKIDCENKSEIETISKIVNRLSFKTENKNKKNKILQNTSFTQIKNTMQINFDSFMKSLSEPKYATIITNDYDRCNLLHKFNRILDIYYTKMELDCDGYSHPWDKSDAEQIVSLYESQYGSDFNKDLIKKLAFTCPGKLCPIDSIFGSIAGQEVIKSVSGKFVPINQWFYYDAINTLPTEMNIEEMISDVIACPLHDKYLGIGNIYGNTFLEKIKKSSVFIVGAGAIGCEHLKNFCKIGISNIHITDMDTIEKSNLNRQFLFRNSDIGKFKSESAAKAIKIMNPDTNVKAYKLKVGAETLSIFSEKFFESLTAVTTALDNVGARLFVDKLCVDSCTPMIDSGTLGAKGNTQTIIPYMTESYGSTQDPVDEKSIPVCTLKNFPYLIEHTCQWARDQFDGLFVKGPQNYNKYVNTYLNDKQQLDSITPSDLEEIGKYILFVYKHLTHSQTDCIKLGYDLYHKYFRDQIYYLTKEYPYDKKTDEGIPFWSGTKKFPTIGKFDPDDKMCLNFVLSTANLWADVCGIKHVTFEKVKKCVGKFNPPKMTEQEEIITDDKQKQTKECDTKKIIDLLPNGNEIKYDKCNVLEFEKDNDNNFHIDFITSTSNLRATNYGIPIADKLKTKGIAGKIIPAIATTTSLVSGLVTLELIKIIQGIKNLSSFDCSFINLSQSMFAFSEPISIRKSKIGNYEYSMWNNEKIHGDVKLSEIMDHVYNLINSDKYSISIISVNKRENLWTEIFDENRKKQRENTNIKKLYMQTLKLFDEQLVPNPLQLQIDLTNNDDYDEELAPISIKIYFE